MIQIKKNNFGEIFCECPVCKARADVLKEHDTHNGEDFTIVKCDYCGLIGCPVDDDTFYSAIGEFDIINLNQLAGYLFENKNGIFYITSKNCKQIADNYHFPEKSNEFLDKVCVNLYSCGNNYLKGIQCSDVRPSFGYANSMLEIKEMFQDLIDRNYVKIVTEQIMFDYDDIRNEEYYRLTADGLKYTEELLNTNKNSTKAFIDMRFSEKLMGNPRDAIKSACKECGITAKTVDENQHNGDITDKIIAEIKTSRFVVADFTDNNQGVYYEAGFAKGLGIPVIKTCSKKWFDEEKDGVRVHKLHFDIEHDNLILWKDAEDLKDKLKSRIEASIL